MKTGDFKVCPECETRHKSAESVCSQCGRPLGDVAIGSSEPNPLAALGVPLLVGRWRWVIAGGMLLAIIGALGVRLVLRVSPYLVLAPRKSETQASAPFASPAGQPIDPSRDAQTLRLLKQTAEIRSHGLTDGLPSAEASPAQSLTAAPFGIVKPSGPGQVPAYSDTDLARAQVVAPAPPMGTTAASPGSDFTHAQEQAWRSRAQRRREALEAAEARQREAHARVEQLRVETSSATDMAAHARAQDQLNQALAELERADKQVQDAQRDRRKLESQARGQDVPSDWLEP